jgi:hypothetical protein
VENALQEKIRARAGSTAAYLAILFLVPLLLLSLAFCIATTDWFFYHDNYFALRNIGYSLTLHHADCRVVLTGDSSALTGLDPATVTRLTGLRACNLAEGVTVTAVTGSYPLDAYLQRNAPPKYIVFMLTPSMFRPSSSWHDTSSYYEGILYLLRFERNNGGLKTVLSHPIEALSFSAWAAHGIFADAFSRLTDPHKYDGLEDPALRRQRHNGLFTFYSGPETSCFRNGWDKQPKIPTDPEWLAGLRSKYGVNGTRVLINVAPVADCDDMKDVYERDLRGLHDNPLEVLPIGMFNNQDVHFTPEGAEHVSAGVAQQILALEAGAKP